MAKYRLATEDALGGKVDKDSIVVNVKDRGAIGDGTTDDTAALNAAVAAGAGGTVLVPEGTYMVASSGINLNQPKTRLVLDEGATLSMIPNDLGTSYAVVNVSAADCALIGGTIKGDMVGHTGASGQYGHGVKILHGAHRFRLKDTYLTECWGDGAIIEGLATGESAEDVLISGVVSHNNRRQGLSVISSKRLRVIGSVFSNTGQTLASAPSSGVQCEPSGGSRANVDAVFIGCIARNNVGGGFNNTGLNGYSEVTFVGCQSVDNTSGGFGCADGPGATQGNVSRFEDCVAAGNGGNGFLVSPNGLNSSILNGCVAELNVGYGFNLASSDKGHNISSCTALNNGNSGFMFGSKVSGSALYASGNNTATQFFGQITVDNAAGVRLSACVSDVGTNTTKPTRGFRITAGSTDVVLIGCSTRGTFSSGAYSDLGTGTIAFPIPGVAKQTGTPAAATDPATTQTLVNDLRTKLLALGIIA